VAIIQEYTFFSWRDLHNDLQNLGDLERFKLVIETIPDQTVMKGAQTSMKIAVDYFCPMPFCS
jgi:hypothetical protein